MPGNNDKREARSRTTQWRRKRLKNKARRCNVSSCLAHVCKNVQHLQSQIVASENLEPCAEVSPESSLVGLGRPGGRPSTSQAQCSAASVCSASCLVEASDDQYSLSPTEGAQQGESVPLQGPGFEDDIANISSCEGSCGDHDTTAMDHHNDSCTESESDSSISDDSSFADDCDDDLVMHFLEEDPEDDNVDGPAHASPPPSPPPFEEVVPPAEVPQVGHPGGDPDVPGDPDDPGDPEDSGTDEDDEDEDDEEDTFSFNDVSLNAVLQFGQQGCTLREAILLNLATSIKHNWTYEALVDSLSSWSTALGRGGVIPNTKKKLRSLIRQTEAGTVKYAYCPTCLRYYGRYSRLGAVTYCPCGAHTPREQMHFFISLSLKRQLQHFLATPGMAQLLQYRETRRKNNNNAMEDIMDGEVYEQLLQNGRLTVDDYTYIFNSDGFLLFRRRSMSVWVLLIRLNELPPNVRQRHLFIAGVWIGKKEPNMNTFMRPFVRQAHLLETHGLMWERNGQQVNSKFLPIGSCVDAVARAMIMNQHQFNGHYGCFLCTHPGFFLAGSMKYPLLPYGGVLPAHVQDRTHNSILEAMQMNEFHQGQKGPSEVMLLQHFNMAEGNCMDDLHPFYAGVTEHFLELLIDLLPNAVRGQVLATINLRMQNVRTPVQMARKWTSILKRTSWKGSQWGYFIKYHAVLCFLNNGLPEEHVEHVSMLSYALFVFSQDSIAPADFQRASDYTNRFLELFQQYHGAENMRYNIHMLRHAARSRRCWGPAWTVSTFNFESWNRRCGKAVTSPKGAADQIVARHFLKFYVHTAVHRHDVSERVRAHLSDLLFSTQRKLAVQVEPEIFLLGRGVPGLASPEEIQLLRAKGIYGSNITVYERLLVRGIEFRCSSYHVDTNSDNSVACTWDGHIITINKIFVMEENNANICGLFVAEHRCDQPLRFADHIRHVLESTDAFFRAAVLRVPAIKMAVGVNTYVVPMSSCHEID